MNPNKLDIIHEPLRYAHAEGHTDVCYSSNGKHFITCGSDGDIRIYSIEADADPTHICIGEWARSVCQKNDKFYVATGSNEIQILTYPEGERDGVLIRGTDPYNQIAISKNHNMVALAGEGMSVTVMDLNTKTVKNTFKDLNGPCLSAAICPNAQKLAASCGDGKLRIWELETENLLKEIKCFDKTNSFANTKTLCRLDFDPNNGNKLAYPQQNAVKILDINSFTEKELTCSKISSEYSVLKYSNCGKYLAAATLNGEFVIWETSNNKIFKTSTHESGRTITGIMFNPSKENREIIYTDIEGQLGLMRWNNKIEESKSSKEKLEDNEFSENEVNFDDFLIEDDDRGEETASKVADDDILQSDLEKIADKSRTSSRTSSHHHNRPHSVAEISLQGPFMPTSTPEHLDSRYLCWNEVGIVKSYGNHTAASEDDDDDDSDSKSIEVEFHDSTFHNSMMLQNYQNYFMGSIGKGALVVANNSQLMVIPLALTNKEWTLKVEEYEEIVLVAASEHLVCFATGNYLIRICTIFGTQKAIVSIPGPLVSMSAFQNLLLVAYHNGAIRNNDQCINLKLFKFEDTTVECNDLGSALGPESTLYWIGFSDCGTPGMMDSLGMLSLFPAKCNTWIPFCDTVKYRTNPGDNFFVITVFESFQAVGGIRCKGTLYPGFLPRPTICELPIEPPFSENGTDKTQMEMSLFTWSTLNIHDTDKKYKETALKIFALACRNDLDNRAFELMQLFGNNNQQLVNLGLKYANKVNKRRLAEKLIELANKLQNDDNDDDDENASSFTINKTPSMMMTPDNSSIIKPSATKFTLSKSKSKKLNKEETEPVNKSSIEKTENEQSVIDTQESVISGASIIEATPERISSKFSTPPVNNNPFLKKPKKSSTPNPLSLTDKNAGVSFEMPQSGSTKKSTEIGGAKRKLLGDEEKLPAGKQRKLNQFMFEKRT